MSLNVAMIEITLTVIAMPPRLSAAINAASEKKKALISAVKALAATAWRSGGADGPALRPGLTEIATNSRPTSAAPAPALATKKLVVRRVHNPPPCAVCAPQRASPQFSGGEPLR